MKKVLFILFLYPFFIEAQQYTIFRNGIVHSGTGALAQKSTLIFQGEKIVWVGKDTFMGDSFRVVDCSGKHIYPGLIALDTRIGINEIEAVRATNDTRESGAINPNARVNIAYNTDSKVIPTVRSNGILMAQVVPDGQLWAGQSSVFHLDGWNWEDAVYLTDEGLHLYWPDMTIRYNSSTSLEDQQKQIQTAINELVTSTEEALRYFELNSSGFSHPKDLRWDAFIPVFQSKKKVFIHCNTGKEMEAAIHYAEKYRFDYILSGCYEAGKYIPLLKEHKTRVIFSYVHALPGSEDDAVDLMYKTPFSLHQAGISFAISQNGFWQQRNLAFLAGSASAYGLKPEEALKAITLTPAEFLGISTKTGSLEVGKDATLLLTSGDLLDMKSSQIEAAWFRGNPVNLNNIQTDLYLKYCKKYGIKP